MLGYGQIEPDGLMATYWLHVNHPNNKAIIHREDGCGSAQKAIARKKRGLPYGEVRGDQNGRWDGPFSTLGEAEAAQRATGKTRQDQCGVAACSRAD